MRHSACGGLHVTAAVWMDGQTGVVHTVTVAFVFPSPTVSPLTRRGSNDGVLKGRFTEKKNGSTVPSAYYKTGLQDVMKTLQAGAGPRIGGVPVFPVWSDTDQQ